MNKCIKITCTLKITKTFTETVQKQAQALSLEGLMQAVGTDTIKIVACGSKENIEAFVDFFYKQDTAKKPLDVEVEPFVKDKDYRGVFRLIA